MGAFIIQHSCCDRARWSSRVAARVRGAEQYIMARSTFRKSTKGDVHLRRAFIYAALIFCSALACIAATSLVAVSGVGSRDTISTLSAASLQHARRLFEQASSVATVRKDFAVEARQHQQHLPDSSSSCCLHHNASLVTTADSIGYQYETLQQAMEDLRSAGIELEGVQLLQLDRFRMEVELHARGRLQQRKAALEAELLAAAAASQAVSSSSSSSSTGLNTKDSSNPISRGVLIVAGGRDQLSNALVTIMTLQQVLQCTLPIEIVYYGPQEQDTLLVHILKQYNITNGGGKISLIDGYSKQLDLGYHTTGPAAAYANSTNIKGFATKAHALAYVTSFQQVLMLDADNLPLLNPEELFKAEPFISSGNLFWPDFWHHLWMDGSFFKKLGQAVPWEADKSFTSAESGQVLIDRLKHHDVLEWLFWLNAHSNITYGHMHGDKDTFRLAFALAGKLAEHRQVKLPPRDAMSLIMNGSMPYFQHQGMVQHTPDEKPAFLHRTDKGKFFPFCAAKNDTSDCYASHFTIPLTEGQAYMAMQASFSYRFDQVDVSTFKTRCRTDIPVNPDRPDDPRRCPALDEGQNMQPVPLVPIHAFTRVSHVIRASYYAFERVRELIEKGTQVLAAAQVQQQQQQQQRRWMAVAVSEGSTSTVTV